LASIIIIISGLVVVALQLPPSIPQRNNGQRIFSSVRMYNFKVYDKLEIYERVATVSFSLINQGTPPAYGDVHNLTFEYTRFVGMKPDKYGIPQMVFECVTYFGGNLPIGEIKNVILTDLMLFHWKWGTSSPGTTVAQFEFRCSELDSNRTYNTAYNGTILIEVYWSWELKDFKNVSISF